ncbi:AFG1-like ATPase-domain-containing protein [Xylariales sp. AK1849]|nr:AFG1-like ATPase-domain-containing protein [Xylariales sp. AK1849]
MKWVTTSGAIGRRSLTSRAVTITDPLHKYQSLIATGLYSPDPAQHRLAIHLQKIYHRLKDYSPSVEYQPRLKALSNALDESHLGTQDGSRNLAVKSHPIRKNPFFARFLARTEPKDTLALTRVLTSHEAATNINSPQGLFLSGEVGTGKSMLLDLLADGLPTSRKRRWHFNTFMLYTLSQLEHYRKTHPQLGGDNQQYSLLWMAREMIEKSPILFLDEFQLPDRAASKILSNLFTVFFQLGGVLVASSNRMPEELEKATGFQYVPPSTTGGLIGKALRLGQRRAKGELFGSSSDFASFLEVLKARCEFWQMEGGKDWRRREVEESSQPTVAISETPLLSTSVDATAETLSGGLEAEELNENITFQTPRNYFLLRLSDQEAWNDALATLTSYPQQPIPWESSTLTIYGRTVTIPQQHNGIAYWSFADLVLAYGPADYITMASTFHTFIIDRIPTLTVLKKNEARRLITLLDALYEARCKLVVRAEVGPDDLFFPEARLFPSPSTTDPTSPDSNFKPITAAQAIGVVDADAILPETIAEAYQDVTSPFRPNISTYDPDQDSDFGLDQQSSSPRLGPDFSNTGAFTGEDERFAYKRAASRLWELCGARWHAREGKWWTPLPVEARHWEGGGVAKRLNGISENDPARGDVAMGESKELDEPAGLQRLRVEYLKKTMLGEGQETKPGGGARADDRFARSRGSASSSDGFE